MALGVLVCEVDRRLLVEGQVQPSGYMLRVLPPMGLTLHGVQALPSHPAHGHREEEAQERVRSSLNQRKKGMKEGRTEAQELSVRA